MGELTVDAIITGSRRKADLDLFIQIVLNAIAEVKPGVDEQKRIGLISTRRNLGRLEGEGSVELHIAGENDWRSVEIEVAFPVKGVKWKKVDSDKPVRVGEPSLLQLSIIWEHRNDILTRILAELPQIHTRLAGIADLA